MKIIPHAATTLCQDYVTIAVENLSCCLWTQDNRPGKSRAHTPSSEFESTAHSYACIQSQVLYSATKEYVRWSLQASLNLLISICTPAKAENGCWGSSSTSCAVLRDLWPRKRSLRAQAHQHPTTCHAWACREAVATLPARHRRSGGSSWPQSD